jgi:AraC family transcriptional regulator, arabinose operon regulatory protein
MNLVHTKGVKMFQLPKIYFKNETVHRIIGNDLQNGVLSCGFLHKKTKSLYDTNITYNYYGALLVLSGEGVHIDNEGKEYRLYPGCFVQRIPGKLHSTLVHPDGQWVEFFICFGRGLYESLQKIKILEYQKDVLFPGVNLAILDIFQHFMNTLKITTDDQLPLALAEAQRIIFTIYHMQHLNTSTNEDRELIHQACIMINSESSQRPSIQEISKKLGIGYEKFRKLFKEVIGVAPGDYMIQGRLNTAKAKLMETGGSVKEIALSLGYPDAFTFSRQFKKVVGVSPSEFKTRI